MYQKFSTFARRPTSCAFPRTSAPRRRRVRRHTRAARTGETTAMRAFPLASLCLSLGLGLGLVAASETATAPSSFTCVSANRGGTCFVASCAQLHAAVDAGVAHITLYRNLTKCSFPLRVSRPLTVRGACGDGTSKCSVSGGGVLVRQDRSACRQRCTRCENGQGPLFDVREGGRLTLANLELRGACNARDGAGGAVVVRGSTSNGRDDDAEKKSSAPARSRVRQTRGRTRTKQRAWCVISRTNGRLRWKPKRRKSPRRSSPSASRSSRTSSSAAAGLP